MSETFKLSFYLSDFAQEIIEQKAKELGLDFKAYSNKVLHKAMLDANFVKCNSKKSGTKRKNYQRHVTKKKHDFIHCLANKKSTTVSSVVELLLIKGL